MAVSAVAPDTPRPVAKRLTNGQGAEIALDGTVPRSGNAWESFSRPSIGTRIQIEQSGGSCPLGS